ncbi:MAG: hypothetical protein AMJ95_09700 [Omnitrophica WOR_2 bacterium SM23_72]|nr:MAG: hypothetical protein AMJ95_09700 [Omnitrophica WOR_2 bacterium SM23_72]
MRDILYKNLTSTDKRKRMISSSETVDKEGIRSIIKRHFICMLKEVENEELQPPMPYLYVLKVRNTKEQKEKFFCRIKGSLFAIKQGKLYLILFMHSLKIDLTSIPSDLVKNSEGDMS